jgi:pilus assembly protein Flp/PilA
VDGEATSHVTEMTHRASNIRGAGARQSIETRHGTAHVDSWKEVNRMFDFMRTYLQAVRDREEGQALVEYALILFLVSIAAVVILGTVGGQISDVLQQVSSNL